MVKIKSLKTLKIDYLLILILLFAAIVRIWGIGFGLPNTNCRPDEEQIVDIIHSHAKNFHPGGFNYPSLYKYINLCSYGLYYVFGLLAGKYKLLSDFVMEIHLTNYKALYLINRFLSASFGLATVFICYKIAARLFDRKTALISAFYLSFAYLHVRDSHFGTVDASVVFFIMCSMLFIIKAYQDNSTRNYIFAGIFAGLAASTKYPGILIMIPMFIVNSFGIAVTKDEDKAFAYTSTSAKRMVLFLILLAAAFLLGTPYAIFDFKQFISGVVQTAGRYIHGEGIDLGRGWWYHLKYSLPLGLGFSLFYASLAGVLILAKMNLKKALILCSFPVAYYVIIGQGYGVFLRYVMPVIPYLCITAAVFTVYLVNGLGKYLSPRFNKAAMLMFPLLIIAPSVYNILCFDTLLAKKDNRLIATEWIDKNLPGGSSIAIFNSGYGIQLPLIASGSPDKDMRAEDNVKGFDAYGWDGQSHMSKYIVWLEAAVKVADLIDPEQKAIIQKYYYPLVSFIAFNIDNKSNWFDQEDNFYMPFAGFKEIQRPGPNIYIYEKKKT